MGLLNILFWSIAIPLLGLSLSTAGWYKLWAFEMLGTAYLWFAGVTVVLWCMLLLVKSLRRKRVLNIILTIALSLYAESILGWYVPRPSHTQGNGSPVTVMTYNVNYQLWNTAAVEKIVRQVSADIFGLVEPYKEQAAALQEVVQDLYPYYYRSTGGNLSLFSRYRIIKARTDSLESPHHSLFATLDVRGKVVQVIVLRPPAPLTPTLFNRRNQVLRSLAEYVKKQQSPVILMGDFNTTSWSIYFREFVQRSGLRSASQGYGLHPTWYYATPKTVVSSTHQLFRFIKIPIDHIFVSRNIEVNEITTGSAGVSDHRPLISRIRL
jgi:endonuclease/exonuclease/phosphatase (EEP) superfamily protein YafD